MTDIIDEEVDYPSAYEALVEFLYLAPVGIVKFRPDGAIDMANPTAAQLLMPLAPDGDMSDLYRLLGNLAPDLRAHVERFQEPAGQIFDQMQLVVPNTRSTLMLDINKINDQTMMAAIQNITDLTDARRRVLQETETQRLFASVFMRINAPVVVIRTDGFILMANAAFQQLLGYDSKGLIGLNIDALLPTDGTKAERAARSQQLIDGTSYQVAMDVIAKDGTRSQIIMNSAILREADAKQLRVVTLIPAAMMRKSSTEAGKTPVASPVLEVDSGISQVMIINLFKIRTAVGGDWHYMGARAMALSEQLVKQLLSPLDILKRGKDTSFVIWFANDDQERNTAILTRATLGIRHVFMTEFGTKIANRVKAAIAA